MKQGLSNYLDAVTAFSATREEPAWMLELRKQALAKADELELPHFNQVKYKNWKLNNIDFAENTETTGEVPAFDNMEDTPVILQQGDLTVFEQLSAELAKQGVIFTDLFSAMHDYPELVQEYYMTKVVKPDEDKLAASHAAFMNSGVFLYVPKNVVIEQPLEAIFYPNNKSSQHLFKHVLIVAEDNSEFTYLERLQKSDAKAAEISANIIVEVVAKPGARIRFAAIDQLGKNVTAYVNRRGYLMKDATIDWAIGAMNDGNVIADFDSDLVGEGAHAEVKAVAISSSSQVQGVDTRVTNKAPHTVGHILQHGVVRDKATLTFNGIGHILKKAKGADAQQESRVLMLSDEARGDANPILLIDENDVIAGHAASIGQVDPEELYYLMSRGLTKEVAEQLVIRGFLGPVITAIPIRRVQNELIDVIERKLKE